LILSARRFPVIRRDETYYKPDFELVENLAKPRRSGYLRRSPRSPEDVRTAFDCGAFAVVVGGAITGIDQLVQQFVSATPLHSANLQAL
jgi:putative N-acetylmannosamine-6-phosphate epimerase